MKKTIITLALVAVAGAYLVLQPGIPKSGACGYGVEVLQTAYQMRRNNVPQFVAEGWAMFHLDEDVRAGRKMALKIYKHPKYYAALVSDDMLSYITLERCQEYQTRQAAVMALMEGSK